MRLSHSVIERVGNIQEFSWSSWKRYGIDKYRNLILTCPIRAAGDGATGFVTSLNYTGHALEVRRQTNKLCVGSMRRLHLTGSNICVAVDRIFLVDHSDRLQHVNEPGNWGWRDSRKVNGRAYHDGAKVNLTAEEVEYLPWFWPELHKQIEAGAENQDFTVLVDWLIDFALLAPYFTVPGEML